MESKAKLISIIAFAALAAVAVYLVLNEIAVARNPVLLAIQIASGVLMIWARFTFGTRSFHAGANPTAGAS